MILSPICKAVPAGAAMVWPSRTICTPAVAWDKVAGVPLAEAAIAAAPPVLDAMPWATEAVAALLVGSAVEGVMFSVLLEMGISNARAPTCVTRLY